MSPPNDAPRKAPTKTRLMKLTHPISIAALAGTLAAIASIFLHAGADNKNYVAAPASQLETAIFAGGCFWCVESDFDKVDGVIETISGYSGGTSDNPTYKTHTSENHLEVVKVVYDPAKVEYGELVTYFLHHIDPTDAGGQFCDRGYSYTTAIFTDSLEEATLAKSKIAAIEASGVLSDPIVTVVRDEAPFYAAEDYHQDFYRKNALRYNTYRKGCGRDKRVKDVWGDKGQS